MVVPALSDIIQELQNDPANIGYKNTDGTWKTPKEIVELLLTKPAVKTSIRAEPYPPTVQELLNAVALTSLVKIPDETLIKVGELVREGNYDGIALLAQVALMKNYITKTDYDAILALLHRTRLIEIPQYDQCRAEQLGWEPAISLDLIQRAIQRLGDGQNPA